MNWRERQREVFEAVAIRYPTSLRWHILYAGPAPGGVVVGQQLNLTMIPKVQLYEFQRPRHIPSITITPHDSSLTRWTCEILLHLCDKVPLNPNDASGSNQRINISSSSIKNQPNSSAEAQSRSLLLID